MEHDIDYINALTKAQLSYLEKIYLECPPFVYDIKTDTVERMEFNEWVRDLMNSRNGYDNQD